MPASWELERLTRYLRFGAAHRIYCLYRLQFVQTAFTKVHRKAKACSETAQWVPAVTLDNGPKDHRVLPRPSESDVRDR